MKFSILNVRLKVESLVKTFTKISFPFKRNLLSICLIVFEFQFTIKAELF